MPARISFQVYVEGEQTEDLYLTHWARSLREWIIVDISPFHGTPYSLVERAVKEKKASERAQRRGRGSAPDQVWCVFDRDEHPRYDEAIALAAANGIGVATSNPCIELWFVLHLNDQMRYVSRHEAQRLCKEALGFGKCPVTSDLDRLRVAYESARSRALALDKKHKNDGSPSMSNPSTSMWRLIDAMLAASGKPA